MPFSVFCPYSRSIAILVRSAATRSTSCRAESRSMTMTASRSPVSATAPVKA